MDGRNKKAILIFGLALLLLLAAVAVIFIVSGMSGSGRKALAPYNVALTFGDDPKTMKNVNWYTEKETSKTVVQYHEAAAGSGTGGSPRFDSSLASEAEGFSERIDTFRPEKGQEHSATAALETVSVYRHGVYLTGLRPGTKYVYRAGDGSNWSAAGSFTTAPDADPAGNNSFSFLIFSDMQGFIYSDYELWGNVFEEGLETCPDPAFMVNMGDFVELENNSAVWNYYFSQAKGMNNLTTVPVTGNKDEKMLQKYFLLGSLEGVNALNGYYSFDYMNVHFTVLNTGDGNKDLSKSQLRWLQKDLESDSARNAAYRIVMIHKAPYSDRNHADDIEIVQIRSQVLPLFEQYNVDVVLEAHDHYYFRSVPVTGGGLAKAECEENIVTRDGKNVTVYSPSAGRETIGGPVYFMHSSSGIKQHNKSFREMPEIIAARSELLTNPTFCVCEVGEDGIFFHTYALDRYRLTVSTVESWGIKK